MRIFSLLLLAACTGGDTASQSGTTWHITPAADGEWDDAAAAGDYRAVCSGSIQACIDAASAGDVIDLPSGTYVEDLTMKEGVDVIGSGQASTIIEGSVSFLNLTADTMLARLWVRDPLQAFTGTGVSVVASQASLVDVSVSGFDIGINLYDADNSVVSGCILQVNEYGLWADDTNNVLIANNLVRGNNQAGITNYTGDGQIIYNTLVENAFGASGNVGYGGAIQVGNGTSEVIANNIAINNWIGINCQGCANSFSYNNVWGNSTNYINDAKQSPSDLNLDPQLVNPAAFDYRLTSISPTIDAANQTLGVTIDFFGESRPQGGGYDIGFDEFSSTQYDLQITEVLSNVASSVGESIGEFVEIRNFGSLTIDLAGLIVSDGDDTDTLTAFSGGATTVPAGAYAVIVDPNYNGAYSIPAGVTVVTTMDTSIGNGLTTSDRITLFEADASTVISTFSYPKDPGDGVSMEMVSLTNGDVTGNWRGSVCASGSSPGEAHCFPPSGDPAGLVITEVLANGWSEANDEYVELFNPTSLTIDASGLVISDGDATDVLRGFANSGTLIGPGEHALILDPGYNYSYFLPNGIVTLTTGDLSIGNGLATTDPVTLYKSDGSTVIDAFSSPSNPGDGYSVEKIDYAGGDVSSNWQAHTTSCVRGRSPGLLNGAAGGICDQLLINEVMSNALNEDRGEYVELYNAGFETVELAGLQLSDGTQVDTLAAFGAEPTTLLPGQFGVIVDAEYDFIYGIPANAVIVTTTDTTLGNGLGVKDEIVLSEGGFAIDVYRFPRNAGNGISVERIWEKATDAPDNWVNSTCLDGASPGENNCAVGGSTGGSGSSAFELVLSEVMANPLNEDTGEYVEIYNYGSTTVDLKNFVLWDGDQMDMLFGYASSTDTLLAPGQYAVIVDFEYANDYTIPSSALVLTTGDTTLGSGLSTSDGIWLFEPDGSTLIDSFSTPFNPGNGVSIDKFDLLGGDVSSNWVVANCPTPGAVKCP